MKIIRAKEKKVQKALRRTQRVRRRLAENLGHPRLTVFRSNRYLWAQLINDKQGRTLLALSTKTIKKAPKVSKKVSTDKKKSPVELAYDLGFNLGKKALEKNIKYIRFDRGSYRYHGRVKALAEGARKSGLKF